MSGYAGNLLCVKKCFHDRMKAQVYYLNQLAQINQLTPIIHPCTHFSFLLHFILFTPQDVLFLGNSGSQPPKEKRQDSRYFTLKDKVSRNDSPAPFCVYVIEVTDKERLMGKNNTSHYYTLLQSERKNKRTALSLLQPRKQRAQEIK